MATNFQIKPYEIHFFKYAIEIRNCYQEYAQNCRTKYVFTFVIKTL